MALTGEEKLFLTGVLVVLMVFVILFELRVMRGKAKEARKVSQRKDEAYNSILTTRSVMNVLEREGVDTAKARAIFDRAQYYLSSGQYGRTMDLCESARTELMKCRQTVSGPAENDGELNDELDRLASDIIRSNDRPSSSAEYKGTRLPVEEGSGYLSAKFEMDTARDEISRAPAAKVPPEARSLLAKAEKAFEAADYQKALSFAVRARKAACSDAAFDSIPLRKHTPVPASADKTEDISEVEDAAAVENRCTSCNSMIMPDDVFCATCGAPAARARVCASCGQEAKATDRFCRKCGKELA